MEKDTRNMTAAELQQHRQQNATYTSPTTGSGTPRGNPPNVTMGQPPVKKPPVKNPNVTLGNVATIGATAATAANELKSTALSSALSPEQGSQGGEGYQGATEGDPSGLGAFKYYNPSNNRPELPSITTNFSDLRGMSSAQANFFGDQRRAIRDAKAEADQYRFMASNYLSKMSPGRAGRIAAGLADSVRDDAKLGSEFTGLGMKQLQERDLEASNLRQRAESVRQAGILDAHRIGNEYAMGRDKLSMEQRLTGRKLGSEEKVATLGALQEVGVARSKAHNDAIKYVMDPATGGAASMEKRVAYLLYMGIDKDEVANILSNE